MKKLRMTKGFIDWMVEVMGLRDLAQICMYDTKHTFKVNGVAINFLVTDRIGYCGNYFRGFYISLGDNIYLDIVRIIHPDSEIANDCQRSLHEMFNKNPDQFKNAILSLKQLINDNETKSLDELQSSFLEAFTTAKLQGKKLSPWKILDQLIQDEISTKLVPEIIEACKNNPQKGNWKLEDTIDDFRWSLDYSKNIFGLNIQLGYLRYNCSSANGDILMMGDNDNRDAYKLLKNFPKFRKCVTDKIKMAT